MLLVEVLGTGDDKESGGSPSDASGSPQDVASGSENHARTDSHAAAGPGKWKAPLCHPRKFAPSDEECPPSCSERHALVAGPLPLKRITSVMHEGICPASAAAAAGWRAGFRLLPPAASEWPCPECPKPQKRRRLPCRAGQREAGLECSGQEDPWQSKSGQEIQVAAGFVRRAAGE